MVKTPTITELEHQVLADLVEGRDPWRHHQGTASRPISQAVGRLKRKGYLNPERWADVPSDLGLKTIQETKGVRPPEQNKRLAQTALPGGKVIDREWTVHERYMLYAAGFRAGAGMKAIDTTRAGLGAYDRGFHDGRVAAGQAISAYAAEIGYTPSILRAT